jgi:hypothetical protein
MIKEFKRQVLMRGIQHAFFFSSELVAKPVTQFSHYHK